MIAKTLPIDVSGVRGNYRCRELINFTVDMVVEVGKYGSDQRIAKKKLIWLQIESFS